MGLLQVSLWLLVSISSHVSGQRLRDMMYESIFSGGACYRRLNGTHQIGCSSKYGGSIGVLHSIYGVDDVDWLIKSGNAGPYVPILPLYLFTNEVVDKFLHFPEVIAGIIVINNGSNRPSFFSHENKCPNQRSQWKNTCDNSGAGDSWNPLGTDLMYRDYPFPIFYLPPGKRDDITKIYDCYYRFNSFDLETQSYRSLCAIEMNSFMFAPKNSEVCIRRSSTIKNLTPMRYCDPLVDRSVFFTLFPRGFYEEKNSGERFKQSIKSEKNSYKNESILLITTPMDTTSMFEGLGIGAASTVSGLVTFLTTAYALNLMFPPSVEFDKNIAFVALNGESYDYIGSQRMAWDLLHGVFPSEDKEPPPINPRSIEYHIHLGQLHNVGKNINMFTPNYNESERNTKSEEFFKAFRDNAISIKSNIIRNDYLPPSSVHSFLRMLNSSITNMSSIIITDSLSKKFSNPYFQSVLDDKQNIDFTYLNLTSDNVTQLNTTNFNDERIPRDSIQMKLANISTTLSRTLYKFVSGKDYNGTIEASPIIVDELLHCYLESLYCPLLSATYYPTKFMPKGTQLFSLYVGVVPLSTASKVLGQLSLLLSGKMTNRTKEECKNSDNEVVSYQWISGWNGKGVCIYSTVNYTYAASPAFIETDYDFTSGQYSTWTESVWQSFGLRIFLKPPKWREQMLLGIGFSVFFLSFLIIYFGHRHVRWILENASSSSVENSDESPQSRSHVEC